MKFTEFNRNLTLNIHGMEDTGPYQENSVLKIEFVDKMNSNCKKNISRLFFLIVFSGFFLIPQVDAQVDKKQVKEIEKLKEKIELDPNFYFREYQGKKFVTESSSETTNYSEIIISISKSNEPKHISLDSIFLLNERGLLNWKNIRILPGGYKTDYYPERNIVYYPNGLFLNQKIEHTLRIDENDKFINLYSIETKDGLGYLFEFEYKNQSKTYYKHGVLFEEDLKPYILLDNQNNFSSILNDQVNKLSIEKLMLSRLEGPPLKVLSKINHYGDETYYTNEVTPIEFVGISEEYSAKKAELEKYFVSGLLPIRFVGQTSLGEIYYFQDGFTSSETLDGFNYNLNPIPISYLGLNETVILNMIYNFSTRNGSALLIEVKKKDAEDYYHGLILLDDFKKLMEKIEKEEIGVFVDDRDGAYYKWTKIGDQIWMTENLKYQTSEIGEKDNRDPFKSNNEIYYNYFQAVSACPKGWHLPSDAEWKLLEKYVGVSDEWLDYLGRDYSRGDGIGEKNITGILTTDESLGFFAKYSGNLSPGYWKQSREVGKQAFFWTRTKLDEVNAVIRVLGTDFDGGIVRDETGTHNLFSCRCIKDLDFYEIAENNQIIKDLLQREANGEMTSDDYYNRSVEFLIIGEESRSFDDIENAIKLNNSNLEYKLFKAQFLYLYKFNKEANQIRNLLNDYLTNIKNNEFAYYLAYKTELYDFSDDRLKATSDESRRQKALAYLENAIRLDPKNPYYLKMKSKIHISDQEYGEAIKAIGVWLSVDPKNGEAHNWLGVCELKNFHEKNKSNKINAPEWCGMIAGCYKVTAVQLKEVCSHFYRAINYGFSVDPDYFSLCGELKSAELLEKHRPIIHTGPRGGRYTISPSGNKVYIPRK